MARTSIEWTGHSWGVVSGCTRVSKGCDHCYAMQLAHRFNKPGLWGAGLTRIGLLPRAADGSSRRGPDWTGELRLHPEKLWEVQRWRIPRKVFVCSASDLFHPKVPFSFIAAVWGAMAQGYAHTFQVLTKRPARAAEFFTWLREQRRIEKPTKELDPFRNLAYASSRSPLANVWVGTSVEDQAAAHQRIPHLLRVPAAVRWLSVEPMLGPVSLSMDLLVDWVVCGGESGTGARPFNIDWARWLLAECRDARIPFFMKQLGACVTGRDLVHPDNEGYGVEGVRLESPKGGNMDEWPPDLRVREWPRGVTL